ncbi:MAG: choice-of-anchor I family protein [Gammaproteobacteria bacterium]
MHVTRLAAAVAACLAAGPALAASPFTFSHEWTFGHTGNGLSQAQGAEIVSFDAATRRLWIVGTDANVASPVGRSGIDVLDLDGSFHASIDLQSIGGVNSVDVANGKAAVAITAPLKTDPGFVRFYDTTSLDALATVAVGANPDNVVYAPDGRTLLVANEGEPLDFTLPVGGDAEGSVGIVDAETYAVSTAGFGSFDTASLQAQGVRLFGPNQTPALNLEPEYVAVSSDGRTAVATLQEANAVAFVDLATRQVTAIKAMGLKDHGLPGNALDVSDRDGAGNAALNGNLGNWQVQGIYMPDGIAGFTQDGQQFYVTANEGDGRQDWPGFEEEVRVGAADIDPALDAALRLAHGDDYKTSNDKLSRLTVSVTGDTDGDGDLDRLLAFGGRSFSILDADGNLVFDSGDQLEQIVQAFDAADALAGNLLPDLWDDGRSDNKGPEPESVVIGELAGRTLMFLGLERSNAVMVWDLTEREAPSFLDFLFTAGDVGPEGLHFFTDGGKGYLAVANEVSGTTSLYSVQPVPVPGALWLMGSAIAAATLRRRQR